MKRWYVVSSQSRGEEKAVHHLRRQGYEVYLPRFLKRRSHARKIDWAPAPMFPRYLFVCLDLECDQWLSIRSTIGVSQIICHGESPTPVPIGVIEEIMARENENGLVQFSSGAKFKKGDKVQVIGGAFGEHVGIFDCDDDSRRVFILLNLLGREVKVRLPVEAVSAVA